MRQTDSITDVADDVSIGGLSNALQTDGGRIVDRIRRPCPAHSRDDVVGSAMLDREAHARDRRADVRGSEALKEATMILRTGDLPRANP